VAPEIDRPPISAEGPKRRRLVRVRASLAALWRASAGWPWRDLFLAFALWFCVPATVVFAVRYLALGPEIRVMLIDENHLAGPYRDFLLVSSVVAGGGAILLWGVALLFRGRAERLQTAVWSGTILSPLLVAPFVVALWDWQAFQGHAVLMLTAVLIVGLLFERAARASCHQMIIRPPSWLVALRDHAPRRRRWLPRLLLAALILGFGGYMAVYGVINHYRLQTTSYDLAIFDNIMWRLARGHWFSSTPAFGRIGGNHIQRHATFAAYLFLPFYLLRQNADNLIVIQAFVVAATMVPLYLLGRRRLGSPWPALALCACFAMYAPMQGPMFYDFHFLTTSPFFVLWTIYFFDTGSTVGLILVGSAALLTREDISPGLAMMALAYMLSGKRARAAVVSAAIAGVYFLVVKFVVMPHSGPRGEATTFVDMYSDLVPNGEWTFGGVLRTLTTSPLFALNSLLKVEKLIYVLQLAVPVLFLPFRHRRIWLPLIPAALFSVVASNEHSSEIYFQYTAHWTPYVFAGVAIVLGEWRQAGLEGRVRATAALAAICLASTLVSYHEGALFQHHTFRGGFRGVQFEWTRADAAQLADFRALAKQIPKNASVVATESEVPQLSARANAFTMRVGVDDADYILARVDEVRGEGGARTHLLDGLRTKAYGFVDRKGAFALWKRGGDHARDSLGLQIIGAPSLY
jgi:uncharacterized membrane protein